MSLIGQLPLAAVNISCRDLAGSTKFYRDVLGLKPIEEVDESSNNGTGRKKSATASSKRTPPSSESNSVHFDLGNIRLTLSKMEPVTASTKSDGGKLAQSTTGAVAAPITGHLVFIVENAIDVVYADLAKRGVKFKSKRIYEDTSGKAAWFSDPDGNVIYLWQPPHRDSKNYKEVESIVRHYELVSRALADLREGEDEVEVGGAELVIARRRQQQQVGE